MHVEASIEESQDAGSIPAASIRLARYARSLMARPRSRGSNALSERSEPKGRSPASPRRSNVLCVHPRMCRWVVLRRAHQQSLAPYEGSQRRNRCKLHASATTCEPALFRTPTDPTVGRSPRASNQRVDPRQEDRAYSRGPPGAPSAESKQIKRP